MDGDDEDAEGDLITCPICDGWSPAETGMMCGMCGGEGVIWSDDSPVI